MKFKFDAEEKSWKSYAFAACIAILFYVCLTHIGLIFSYIGKFLNLFQPIFVGAVIAYIVNPLAKLFDTRVFSGIKKDKLRWNISAALALIILIALAVLLIVVAVPQILDNVMSIVNNMSTYMGTLKYKISNMNPKFQGLAQMVYDYIAERYDLLGEIGNIIASNLNNIIKGFSSVGSAAAGFFVAVIIAIYILLCKDSVKQFFRNLGVLVLSPLKYYQTGFMLGKFNVIFSKYIICEIFDAVFVGVANYLFMVICGMPDAFFVSTIVGIANLAPTFGPIVGAAVGVFILLLVSPKAILGFLIFTVVLQTVDAYIVKPKFFGGVLDVPGILILFAIIVFGRLLGIVGMLIAIPVAAILVYLYTEAFIPWLELKKDLAKYNREKGESEDLPDRDLPL